MATQLGMSKKTIYQYFRDKNDLVYQILDTKIKMDVQLCCGMRDNVPTAIDEMMQIGNYIMSSFAGIHPSVFFDLQKYHPDAWQLIQDHKWKFVRETIENNIVRGKEEGLYLDFLNPDIYSRLYVTLTDGVFSGIGFSPNEFKFDELFIRIINFFIRGLANEKGHQYLNNLLNSSSNA
jgi:TetR/AcrR family transcriptional regulator, cholesterol catabolism regulator